jgi:hypothetical protein
MEWIYESPDGGTTVYRYPLGCYDKRELVTGKEPNTHITKDGVVIIEEK